MREELEQKRKLLDDKFNQVKQQLLKLESSEAQLRTELTLIQGEYRFVQGWIDEIDKKELKEAK